MGDKRTKSGSSTSFSMPLTERQQLAYLLSMTAKENKTEETSEELPESRKVKKAKLSPVSSINRPRNKNGETQLHICTMKGDLDTIKSVVKQGADVNCRDNANWTPLHEACNHGHYKIAKFLLKSGANPNAAGLDGDTPLHDASTNGHMKIVLLLLRHGADPHHKNDHSETPIDVAEGEDVIEALQNFDKEMLKDLKPKKDYPVPERLHYKDDGDHIKKKAHKKTISNIDDFLETGSPSQSSSKESSCDSKKSYEREKTEKLYKKEKLYEKQKLYERDKLFDKDKFYDKEKSYSKDHSGKSSDIPIPSEKIKHRKEIGLSKYSDIVTTSKSDSSMRYVDCIKKQKLLSSSSSKSERCNLGEHKSEKVMKKHIESDSKHDSGGGERKRLNSESGITVGDMAYKKAKEKSKKHVKRTDDSEDDMTPLIKKPKERSEGSRHERVMEDSEEDEDNYEYTHAKKVRKHSLSFDSNEGKDKYYVRDERDSKEYPKAKDVQVKQKAEYKEKDDSQKMKLHHVAVQSSSFMKSVMKESLCNFEQRIDKSNSKKLADPRVKVTSESIRSSDASTSKKGSHSFSVGDYKHEKQFDKQRERRISSGSDDHGKEVSSKKVKVCTVPDYKRYETEGVNKEKQQREKSPLRKGLINEGAFDKEHHYKKVETKIKINASKLDHEEKSVSKKQVDNVQKAKTEYVTPEFHDTSLIKKTYSKLDKSGLKEQEKLMSTSFSGHDFTDTTPKVKHKKKIKSRSESETDDLPLKSHKEAKKERKEKHLNKDKLKREHQSHDQLEEKSSKPKFNLHKYKGFLDDSDDDEEEEEDKYSSYLTKKTDHKGTERRDSLSSSDGHKEKHPKKEGEKTFFKQNSHPSESSFSSKEQCDKLKTVAKLSNSENDSTDLNIRKKCSSKDKIKLYSSDSVPAGESLLKGSIELSSKKDVERKSCLADQYGPTSFGDKSEPVTKHRPKSVDILINDNRALEKEKRRKEKQKLKLKRLLSQQEASESTQKSSEIKEKEKKHEHEKTLKQSSTTKESKNDKNQQETLVKHKIGDQKSQKLRQHSEMSDEEEALMQHVSDSCNTDALDQKGKLKESNSEVKSHVKIKDTKLLIDTEMSPLLKKTSQNIASPTKFKSIDAISNSSNSVKSLSSDNLRDKKASDDRFANTKFDIEKLSSNKPLVSNNVETKIILKDLKNVSNPTKNKTKEGTVTYENSMKPHLKTTHESHSKISSTKHSHHRSNEDNPAGKGTGKGTGFFKTTSYDMEKTSHQKIVCEYESEDSDTDSDTSSSGSSSESDRSDHKPLPCKQVEKPSSRERHSDHEDVKTTFKEEEGVCLKEGLPSSPPLSAMGNPEKLLPNSDAPQEFEKSFFDIVNTYLSAAETTTDHKVSQQTSQTSKLGAPDTNDRKCSAGMTVSADTRPAESIREKISDSSYESAAEQSFSELALDQGVKESVTERKLVDGKVVTAQPETSLSLFKSEHELTLKIEKETSMKNEEIVPQNEKVLIPKKEEELPICDNKKMVDSDCVKDACSNRNDELLTPTEKCQEVNESSVLPEKVIEDKVIEEHILTCGPKVDKTPKHKAMNIPKREQMDVTSSDNSWKKHKRKHSDEHNSGTYLSCSKTKKTRSLDSDVIAEKKECRDLKITIGDFSPKKRQKHSKSSDGIECRSKGPIESTSDTEACSIGDGSEMKAPKHVSTREEKVKCVGSGLKVVEDRLKCTDSSLIVVSSMKNDGFVKPTIQPFGTKDTSDIHKCHKLKEVDLNMNLGMNTAALELVKKKKRKRHNEAKESASALRVLKVPTESISVENLGSPPAAAEVTEKTPGEQVVHSSSLNMATATKELPAKSTTDPKEEEEETSNLCSMPSISIAEDIKLPQVSTSDNSRPTPFSTLEEDTLVPQPNELMKVKSAVEQNEEGENQSDSITGSTENISTSVLNAAKEEVDISALPVSVVQATDNNNSVADESVTRSLSLADQPLLQEKLIASFVETSENNAHVSSSTEAFEMRNDEKPSDTIPILQPESDIGFDVSNVDHFIDEKLSMTSSEEHTVSFQDVSEQSHFEEPKLLNEKEDISVDDNLETCEMMPDNGITKQTHSTDVAFSEGNDGSILFGTSLTYARSAESTTTTDTEHSELEHDDDEKKLLSPTAASANSTIVVSCTASVIGDMNIQRKDGMEAHTPCPSLPSSDEPQTLSSGTSTPCQQLASPVEKSDAQYDMYENDYTESATDLHQFDEEKRDEENENAVSNLLNMDRDTDAMDMEDTISPSSHYFNPVSYIQKPHAMKESDNYTDDNTDCFSQDDSSQGSASSVLVDFDTKTSEEHQQSLCNIFDHLNDITKSIADNTQFVKPNLPDHVASEYSESSKLVPLHNQLPGSIQQEQPQNQYNLPIDSRNLVEQFDKGFTTSNMANSISNIPNLPSSSSGAPGYEVLLEKVIRENSPIPMGSFRPDNLEAAKEGSSSASVPRPPVFAPPSSLNITHGGPFQFVSKANHQSEDHSNLSTSSDISLKNDEFSELMLPHPATHPVTSFGQSINDLDSIDTSDLIKPEKVSCGNDILSNSGDSIILKKDMIDGQLGFSTNLSSDEIISKFADCILELDDTDNTYSLREYIPQPQPQPHPNPHSQPQTSDIQGHSVGMIPGQPTDLASGHGPPEPDHGQLMDLPSVIQSKPFVSPHTSATSVDQLNQCNSSNMSVNDSQVNVATPQYYNANNPMSYNVPTVLDSAASEYSNTINESGGSTSSVSQPLYVNTVNTVSTRLSTSDSSLYSPKNIFAHGKMYSPKPTVMGSSTTMSTTQTRRVSLEPCDIFRSIIESNVPIVPDTSALPTPSLPTIPENSNDKENADVNTEGTENKEASASTITATDVKTETLPAAETVKPAVLPRLPRLRNWREAVQRHCSSVSHSVNSQDLDSSLQKIIREPSYKDVVEKASVYNLPEDMVMRHASEKERLRLHMVQEWCRAEQSVELSSKEKGPISAISILYYQKDEKYRKLSTTLDFKSKTAVKPDYHKLRTAKLTELQDKFLRMQEEMDRRHHLEIEAHQKYEQLDTLFDQKNMLRKRYLRYRNKIAV